MSNNLQNKPAISNSSRHMVCIASEEMRSLTPPLHDKHYLDIQVVNNQVVPAARQ